MEINEIYFKSDVEMPEIENEVIDMENACNYNCQCDCGRERDCCNNCYVKCSSFNL